MRRLAAILIVLAGSAFGQEPGRTLLEWKQLPPFPEPTIESALGTHAGALIAVGGRGAGGSVSANLYVLLPGAKQWQSFAWPASPASGGPRSGVLTVSTPLGVVVAGGSTPSGRSSEVLLLKWTGRDLAVERLPDLPPSARVRSGAALGNVAYLAGESGESEPALWSLNLESRDRRWEQLPAPPGPWRVGPGLAAQAGNLYLFGAQEARGQFLLEGYRYTPGAGWTPVAKPPEPMALRPLAAFGASQAHILTLGASSPPRVWAYHTLTDTWAPHGKTPQAFSGDAVPWNGGIAVDTLSGPLHGLPQPRPGAFFPLDYILLGLYLVAMVGIGVYFSRAEKSANRFFLGGRRIPWWAVGLSIFGTSVSSITYLSIPAKAFSSDWVFLLTATSVLLMAPIAIRYYLPHFRRWPITTAYEYLEKRFNFLARLYGSAVFLVFQIGRVGIVLFLPSLSLAAATGIDVYTCILLMGVLSTLYTVMGGIEAVIWTDVVQSIILLGGALLVLLFVVFNVPGGFGAIAGTAWDAGKLHTFNWTWDASVAAVWVIVIGNFFASAYPMTADQTIVQRYLTTTDTRQAARAIWTNALLSIPTTALFLGMGTALWAFYRYRPELLDPTLQNDAILPLFIAQELPAGIGGVMLAAIFAAAMSTLSSSINSVASVLVNDYYRRFRRDATERQSFRAARWISAVFGLFGTGIALLLATWPILSLLDVFYEFLNLVGGGLAGMMALGVLTRRANGTGALVGAAASAAAVWWVQSHTQLNFFLYSVVGLLTAFIVGYAASLLFPAATPEPSET